MVAAQRRQQSVGGAHQPSAHRGYHRRCAAAVNAAAATLPPMRAATVNACATAAVLPLPALQLPALPPRRHCRRRCRCCDAAVNAAAASLPPLRCHCLRCCCCAAAAALYGPT